MIKLVAMDLDGTLLQPDKTISEYTKQVLSQVKERGVHLVLCTGRPLAAIQSYLKTLSLFDDDDYSITFNGGLVQHNQSGRIISSHRLHGKEVMAIQDFLDSHHMTYDIVAGDCLLKKKGQAPTFYESLNKILPLKEITQIDGHDSYNKIVVTADPEQLEQWIPLIQAQLGDDYYLVKTMPTLFEIASPNVNKANGIKALADYLHIEMAEVAAFGDEANDMEMLKEAGYGIAMANATDDVKNIARFVTLTNKEDGVAKALATLVLKERE